MKTKSIFAGLLTTAVCLSMLTACGGNQQTKQPSETVSAESSRTEESKQPEQSEESEISSESEQTEPADTGNLKKHTLYIKNVNKSEKMTATFFNTFSGKSEDIVMKKVREEDEGTVYSCEGNVNEYNMAHVTYDGEVTGDFSFNEFVSGWYISEYGLLPYTEGKKNDYNPKYDTKTFKFDGYDKNVYIWTPEDYDPKAEEKYPTIYMLDGEVTLSIEIWNPNDEGVWNVGEHVTSMMELSDYKAVVVAIENPENVRYDELVPDIGEMTNGGLIKSPTGQEYHSTKRGTAFADFVCNTVMPYVQENYNVSDKPSDNSVAGSSLAGLEAFYITLEHPDKIGQAGALSPAFWAFDTPVWMEYLTKTDPKTRDSFIYIYSGGTEDNGLFAPVMYKSLLDVGYPKDKLIYSRYEKGLHLPHYWRQMYPEFLKAMFTHEVTPLKDADYSELVDQIMQEMAKYIESSAQTEESNKTEQSKLPEVSVYDDGNRDPENIKNYLYYDNSETKWDNVYVYWWNSGFSPITNKLTGEYYPDPKNVEVTAEGSYWPGIEMERVGETGIYRAVMPVGAEFVIFNSGVKDLEVKNGKEAYQTVDLIFDAKTNAGQVYKIDTAQPAKGGRGVEKTKFRYSAGEWSDYKAQ